MNRAPLTYRERAASDLTVLHAPIHYAFLPEDCRAAARISPDPQKRFRKSDVRLRAHRESLPVSSSPTACVTNRSPKSLSGARSQAGTRPTLGCPGRSTALAITVAAASAIAAVSASTVTASAMPSEKLRPRQPLVAIPRIGSPDSIVVVPNREADPDAPPSPRQISRRARGATRYRRRHSRKPAKVSRPRSSPREFPLPPHPPPPPWA